jgi:hypothetical protein
VSHLCVTVIFSHAEVSYAPRSRTLAFSAHNGMSALARTSVLPDATLVGALSRPFEDIPVPARNRLTRPKQSSRQTRYERPASAISRISGNPRNLRAWARGPHARGRFGGNRTRSRRCHPAPTRHPSRVAQPHRRSSRRNRHCVSQCNTKQATVGTKADTEMICGRLIFDAVVSGRLPHSAQSPVRIYNGQGPPTP